MFSSNEQLLKQYERVPSIPPMTRFVSELQSLKTYCPPMIAFGATTDESRVIPVKHDPGKLPISGKTSSPSSDEHPLNTLPPNVVKFVKTIGWRFVKDEHPMKVFAEIVDMKSGKYTSVRRLQALKSCPEPMSANFGAEKFVIVEFAKAWAALPPVNLTRFGSETENPAGFVQFWKNVRSDCVTPASTQSPPTGAPLNALTPIVVTFGNTVGVKFVSDVQPTKALSEKTALAVGEILTTPRRAERLNAVEPMLWQSGAMNLVS